MDGPEKPPTLPEHLSPIWDELAPKVHRRILQFLGWRVRGSRLGLPSLRKLAIRKHLRESSDLFKAQHLVGVHAELL